MRLPSFDAAAPRRTVSLTLNADLVAKARQAGLNLSRVAEAAIAEHYRRIDHERWLQELEAATRAIDASVAEYGLPFGEWGEDGDDEDDSAAA